MKFDNITKMMQGIQEDTVKKSLNIDKKDLFNKDSSTESVNASNLQVNDLGVDMKAKVESKNVTISMRESIHSIISSKAQENNGKSSTIVKNILLKLYNKDSKSFEYPIEPKVVDKQKGMSVNMPVDMIEAIETISKETNKSKSEIVEELVSKYLESVIQ